MVGVSNEGDTRNAPRVLSLRPGPVELGLGSPQVLLDHACKPFLAHQRDPTTLEHGAPATKVTRSRAPENRARKEASSGMSGGKSTGPTKGR